MEEEGKETVIEKEKGREEEARGRGRKRDSDRQRREEKGKGDGKGEGIEKGLIDAILIPIRIIFIFHLCN